MTVQRYRKQRRMMRAYREGTVHRTSQMEIKKARLSDQAVVGGLRTRPVIVAFNARPTSEKPYKAVFGKGIRWQAETQTVLLTSAWTEMSHREENSLHSLPLSPPRSAVKFPDTKVMPNATERKRERVTKALMDGANKNLPLGADM